KRLGHEFHEFSCEFVEFVAKDGEPGTLAD
ncbi:MAG: hypothetical protein H6Q07_1195, partial [Acidobacteria bacterium]|nr:hypothetical protein [Acidobacteriota bacterium]